VAPAGHSRAAGRRVSAGRPGTLERGVTRRSRNAAAAIPRGEFGPCDPRRPDPHRRICAPGRCRPDPSLLAAGSSAASARAQDAFPPRGSGPRTGSAGTADGQGNHRSGFRGAGCRVQRCRVQGSGAPGSGPGRPTVPAVPALAGRRTLERGAAPRGQGDPQAGAPSVGQLAIPCVGGESAPPRPGACGAFFDLTRRAGRIAPAGRQGSSAPRRR
jgi:hypothetical protein